MSDTIKGCWQERRKSSIGARVVKEGLVEEVSLGKGRRRIAKMRSLQWQEECAGTVLSRRGVGESGGW